MRTKYAQEIFVMHQRVCIHSPKYLAL